MITEAAGNCRWGGIIPMFQWVGTNRPALRRYPALQPANCVHNDDGTTFQDHAMSDDEMEVCYQLVRPTICCLLLPTWDSFFLASGCFLGLCVECPGLHGGHEGPNHVLCYTNIWNFVSFLGRTYQRCKCYWRHSTQDTSKPLS